MDNISLFIVLAFATWRLSSLFAREDGPFRMFVEIRKFIYVRTVYNLWRGLFITLNDGIHCMWCNSVWFGLILSPLIAGNLFEWLVYGLSLSAVAILIEEIRNKIRPLE